MSDGGGPGMVTASGDCSGDADRPGDVAPALQHSAQAKGSAAVLEYGRPSKPSLKQRALRGSAISTGGLIGMQALRLAGNLILARLLLPADFGLLALTTAFIQGIELFSDIGIPGSLIASKRGEEPAFVDTAWTLNFIRSLCLYAVACLLAVPVAYFYQTPELRQIIPVMATMVIFNALISPTALVLRRQMRLGLITLVGFISYVAALIAMTAWAWHSATYWALVGGSVVGTVVRMVLTYYIPDARRPRFHIEPEARREILQFGRWAFVSTMTMFLASQLDRLMLARMAAWSVVGIYNMAFILAGVPGMITGAITAQVLQPVLAEVARLDPNSLSQKLRRARSLIIPIAMLGCVAVLLAAPAFFVFLYPAEYHGAALITQGMIPAIWFSLLYASATATLLGVADSRAVAFTNITNLIVTVIAIPVLYRFLGVFGVALATGCGNLSAHLVALVMLRRHGVRIARDDLLYTVLFGLLAGVGLLLAWLLERAHVLPPHVGGLAAGAILLAPLGVIVLHRVWRGIR